MNDQEKTSGNIEIGDVGNNFSGSISINQNVNQPPPSRSTAEDRDDDMLDQLDPVQRDLRNKLFKGLNKHFNAEEVEDLCFELGISYEDLKGETRRGKNRSLVDYLARRQQLAELQAVCRQARPQANW